jgi:hypothetical protein
MEGMTSPTDRAQVHQLVESLLPDSLSVALKVVTDLADHDDNRRAWLSHHPRHRTCAFLASSSPSHGTRCQHRHPR